MWSLVIISTLMHFHYSVIINYSWFVIKSKSFSSFLNVKIKSFIIKQIHISENIKNVPPCKIWVLRSIEAQLVASESEIKSYLLSFLSSWDIARPGPRSSLGPPQVCTAVQLQYCTVDLCTDWIWRAWSHFSGAALQSHWLTDPNFQNCHLTERKSSSRSPSSWSPSSPSSTSSRMSSTPSGQTPSSCHR